LRIADYAFGTPHQAMPSFADILSRFSALAGAPAAFGVTLTAGLLLIGRDWRLSIAALAAQYAVAVVLFAQVIPAQVSGVKLLVGLLSCLILLLSARQAQAIARRRTPAGASAEGGGTLLAVRGSILPAGLPFRLAAALIVGLAAWAVAGQPGGALPDVSADVTQAVFALGGMSLLVIALSEAPLQIGLGLLTFLTGFELFYHAVEPSLSVIALLAGAHFGIAVVTGYVTIVGAAR
jgi:hypothetical protein